MPVYPCNACVEFEEGKKMLYVMTRPKLAKFLKALQDDFELVVFTAAGEQYAHVVLSTLVTEKIDYKTSFSYILSRNQCTYISQNNLYLKDLNLLLGNRSLKDIVLIDNKVQSYSAQMENGIPIADFVGDPNDRMLKPLLKFIRKLRDVEDVRPVIKEAFFKA